MKFLPKLRFYQLFQKLVIHDENDTNNEVRILLYGHYRIAYLIKDTETIDILGVFHGALTIERYL